MLEYNHFLENLDLLRERLGEACRRAGRAPGEVSLLPVTKTHPILAVRYVVDAGLTTVGENRVQEALAKMEDPEAPIVEWELIGHLQSNKANRVPGKFARIQSVDSLKLATRLDRLAGEALEELRCLIQVNAGEDPNKDGFAPDGIDEAFESLCLLPNLRIEGFMTIAPLEGGKAAARSAFERLRLLAERLREVSGLPLSELSMGMSGDLEEAVAEGSTQIRVGSALFGERKNLHL